MIANPWLHGIGDEINALSYVYAANKSRTGVRPSTKYASWFYFEADKNKNMTLFYINLILFAQVHQSSQAWARRNGWLADWLAVQCPGVHCGQSPMMWQVRLSRLAGCVSRSVTSTPPKRPPKSHCSALIYHKTPPDSRTLKKKKLKSLGRQICLLGSTGNQQQRQPRLAIPTPTY